MEMKYPSAYSKDPKERQLGIWVKQFRLAYRLNRLTKKEIKFLESIPEWKWTNPQSNREYEYKKLKWKIIHGFNVSEKIYRIRKLYKKGRLSEREIALCEAIPNWKWEKFNPFQTREDVERVLNEIGDSNIIQYCKDNDIPYGYLLAARKKFGIQNLYHNAFPTKKHLLNFIRKMEDSSGMNFTNFLIQENIHTSTFYKACKKFNIDFNSKSLGIIGTKEKLKKFIDDFNKSDLSFTKFLSENKLSHDRLAFHLKSIHNIEIEKFKQCSSYSKIDGIFLEGNVLKKKKGKAVIPHKTSPEKIKEVKRLLKKGLLYKDISKKIGVSMTIISKNNPNKRYRKSGYKTKGGIINE